MTQPDLVELAKRGNPKAIISLMDRLLQPRGITAQAKVKDDCLHVVLESEQVPDQATLVKFVREALQSLGVKSVKTVQVHGRQRGENFPTWTQEFALGPEVLPPANPKARPVAQFKASLGNRRQWLAFLGSLGIGIGVFAPILNTPLAGDVSYFWHVRNDGVILIGLALISLVLALRAAYQWLWVTGLGALGLSVLGLVSLQSRIYSLKAQVRTGLPDNAFGGLFDNATHSIQLRWGWLPLVLGSGLLLAIVLIQRIKASREVYVTGSIVGLLLLLSSLLNPVGAQLDYYASQVNGVMQSRAKAQIETINRAQQALYLKSEQFSSDWKQLGLPETSYRQYIYNIAIPSQWQVQSTAAAQIRGLKSYTGAVFVIQKADGTESITPIICQTNSPSKIPPGSPQLVGGTLQCPIGAFKAL